VADLLDLEELNVMGSGRPPYPPDAFIFDVEAKP
jgi:hypothetical protein